MENEKEALPYYPVEVTPYGIISLPIPSNQPTEGGTSMKKKIVSLALVLALCLSFLPVTAFAEGEDEASTEVQTWGYLADTSWYTSAPDA